MDSTGHTVTDAWLRTICAELGDAARVEALLLSTEAFAPLARAKLRQKGVRQIDLDDAFSELLMLLVKTFFQFRGASVGEFVTWLDRLAGTIARDYLTRYAREDLETDKIVDAEDLFSGIAAPGGVVEEVQIAELASVMEQALGRIPRREAEAIILRKREKLSVEAIARELNVKLPRARKILYEGCIRFKCELVDAALRFAFIETCKFSSTEPQSTNLPGLHQQPSNIELTIRNAGPISLENLVCSIELAGSLVAVSAASIPANSARRIEIENIPIQPGAQEVAVTLQGPRSRIVLRGSLVAAVENVL